MLLTFNQHCSLTVITVHGLLEQDDHSQPLLQAYNPIKTPV